MSKGKRLFLFFAFFILLPGIISIWIDEPKTQDNVIFEQATPTPSPTQIDCFDVRREKDRLEEENDQKGEDALKEIYMIQKEFLLSRIQELFDKQIISADEFAQIEAISQGTALERLMAFAENISEVSETLDRLIAQKHLRLYYEKNVISLGEQLASTTDPTFEFVLANRKCFNELDITLAESIVSLNVESIKSGWAKKKNGTDFASVLSK